ncbi:hypothetical protein QBC42DRAFT_280791 [Cladorrhinum samala]|uniref:Secreted protein n=1 Tax=Cladorrhinum samala TaxID=585594 RepID=A0AAV9H813_9PEZI|nr:hypothetical protein QBC42DRAFT_280791 [Cladorrhinum samala]
MRRAGCDCFFFLFFFSSSFFENLYIILNTIQHNTYHRQTLPIIKVRVITLQTCILQMCIFGYSLFLSTIKDRHLRSTFLIPGEHRLVLGYFLIQ